MRLDSATESMLRNIYPEVARRIKRTYDQMFDSTGLEMRATEGVRTFSKQNALYTQKNKVTDALPGLSFHQYGLAVDSCFHGSDPYLEHDPKCSDRWNLFGTLAESNGLRWGGRFSFVDRPHAEIFNSFTVKELKLLLEKGSIQAVWQAIDWTLGRSGDEWNSPNAIYKPIDPRI